jgi:hypothetical protein
MVYSFCLYVDVSKYSTIENYDWTLLQWDHQIWTNQRNCFQSDDIELEHMGKGLVSLSP